MIGLIIEVYLYFSGECEQELSNYLCDHILESIWDFDAVGAILAMEDSRNGFDGVEQETRVYTFLLQNIEKSIDMTELNAPSLTKLVS